ncbi:30S ribosomal protein S8 [Striga asiatica]|uniref:30S ribosomal protein S8 n=1 Tax=Striga asiatica TaxID=4170 RepID=A0A5A7QB96_STRAF|nr:30S ribosomal protein S8 [Striga asiatica]
MAAQTLLANSSMKMPFSFLICRHTETVSRLLQSQGFHSRKRKLSIECSQNQIRTLRTCKNCKSQFEPSLNHPRACCYHPAHFGGETKRKFESVYIGGTMDTPESGKVFQYWHCCGSENPFDPGCTAAPHISYDD